MLGLPKWMAKNNINWTAVTKHVVTNLRKIERNFTMCMRYMAKDDNNIVTNCNDWNLPFNAIFKAQYEEESKEKKKDKALPALIKIIESEKIDQ